ncbi:MAG: DUF86 domain-containing protein [Clostridia bacterium]|nr:DUF86 domain-containing protein [Clostridia bacterium]
MAVDVKISLLKMLRYCENAQKYAREISYDDFVRNELYLTFAVFSLSQLGELATVLSNRTDCCARYPELPWVAMKSMRNNIVHNYDGLRLTNIWSTIHNDIPGLENQLRSIISGID